MVKYKEVDYKAPSTRWPLWVIPFLVVLLLVLIGLFIFITVGAKQSKCLIFDCEQPRDKVMERPAGLSDDVAIPSEEKSDKHGLEMSGENKTERAHHKESFITVHGEVLFDVAPQSLPPNSLLKVKVEDVSLMDVASVILGETLVDLSNYSKAKNLDYSIKCKKPSVHGRYGVSAVLNVGWRADEHSWIKRGDFFTDTSYPVIIKQGVEEYKTDVTLVRYQ